MEVDGSAPAVLNAVNEIAVERFLKGEITFDQITKVVAEVLGKIAHREMHSIAEVIEIDREARVLAQNSW